MADVTSGAIASGQQPVLPVIMSGAVSGAEWGINPFHIASGVITSGFTSAGVLFPAPCASCSGNTYSAGRQRDYVYVAMSKPHDKSLVYCHSCAGFNPASGGFAWQREHWIREATPFASHTPACVIADWLEENNKTEAANYMRSLTVDVGG